jgi:creatinine amidohydrolase/Fe(II)-dependent formamide hydrolase-like protein
MTMRSAPFAVLVLMVSAAAPLRAQTTDEQRAARQAEARRAFEREMAAERPMAAVNSVWLEELTWMEVRDALRDGATTAIIATGGIEQNGPYLALGKHNYILEGACEGIARKLGNALCAPIVKLVPEGDIEEPSGHMRYPGTISVREETFQAMLTDVAMSLAAHGFRNIVFIGDSGGNQRGMEAVAHALNARWTDARAHFIAQYYQSYTDAFAYVRDELGVSEPSNEGIHDDIVITTQVMTRSLDAVRYAQRLEAGNASINGVSIADAHEARMIGSAILRFRVNATVRAIEAAIAAPRAGAGGN